MKTTINQEFPYPVDIVITARHLKLYNVVSHPALKPVDYLSMDESGERIITRRTMHLSIPDSMKSLIKPEMAECVEETTWDKKACSAIYNILPKQMGKMLSWSGHVKYKAGGGGTLRECFTTATCNVPLMGSNIEKSIIKGYEKAMAKEFDTMIQIIKLVESGELKAP